MDAMRRKRRRALRRILAEKDADALLLTHLPNVFYLCGFSGSAGALLVTAGSATLFTDGRYTVQARREADGAQVRIVAGSLARAIGERLRALGCRRVALEANRVSVAQQRLLRRAGGTRVRWVAVEGWVERLRARKDPREVAVMRRAARMASRVLEEVLPLVRPGIRENEVAAEIEYRMRRAGASGPSFETIVASGARSALPHARPSGKRLRKNELVVLDLGVILRHYCSDLTRTVYLGRAPDRVRRWYAAVLEAQQAARQALRPGVLAAEVDRAARQVLERSGLGRYFVHGTGHGLGLEVHEEPRLAAGQKARIEEGFVVTVEPGVYREGFGGIRIEDDVVVTARGPLTLTDAPRDLIEI
jgi:Xaa-Pro aminopeptidase